MYLSKDSPMFHYIADQKFNVKKVSVYFATVFTIIVEVVTIADVLWTISDISVLCTSRGPFAHLGAEVFLKRTRLALQLYSHFRIA